MVEQVEWFSDTSGESLGAIAEGKGVAGWNYVILERNRRGTFHVRKVMTSFYNSEVARVDLLLCMQGSEKIAKIDVLLSMVESEKVTCQPTECTCPVDLACSTRSRRQIF